MIKQKKYACPICAKSIEIEDGNFDKFFPFCGKRCQQVDLGLWATSSYSVPGPDVISHEDDDLEE